MFVHLKLNKTVEIFLAPGALTRNDLVNILCDFCSVTDTILRDVCNPQQAVHVWTATMLEFNAVPEVLQMAEWASCAFHGL